MTLQWTVLRRRLAESARAGAQLLRRRLFGWEITAGDGDWFQLGDPAGGVHLDVPGEEWYEPPVSPERPGDQGKIVRFEILVDDLDAAIADAVEAGARLADHQPADRRTRACCGSCSIPPAIPSASSSRAVSSLRSSLGVVLREVVDDVAVDRVDEREATRCGGSSAEDRRMRHVGRLRSPRHPSCANACRTGKPTAFDAATSAALLVDAEMPARRDAVHADEREGDRDDAEPLVHEDAAVVITEPQQEAGDRDTEVDEARDAAPAVVGELVGADERRDVELVGKLVPVLGVLCGHHDDATRPARVPPGFSVAATVRCWYGARLSSPGSARPAVSLRQLCVEALRQHPHSLHDRRHEVRCRPASGAGSARGQVARDATPAADPRFIPMFTPSGEYAFLTTKHRVADRPQLVMLVAVSSSSAGRLPVGCITRRCPLPYGYALRIEKQ